MWIMLFIQNLIKQNQLWNTSNGRFIDFLLLEFWPIIQCCYRSAKALRPKKPPKTKKKDISKSIVYELWDIFKLIFYGLYFRSLILCNCQLRREIFSKLYLSKEFIWISLNDFANAFIKWFKSFFPISKYLVPNKKNQTKKLCLKFEL